MEQVPVGDGNGQAVQTPPASSGGMGYSTGNPEWDAIFNEALKNGGSSGAHRPGATVTEDGWVINPNIAINATSGNG